MKSSGRAFTLIELLIAAAITLIAILGLLAVFLNCMFLSETNNNLVTAANDAQYVLEQIKGLPYAEIAAYTAPVLSNLNNETITLTRSVEAKIAEVNVTVSWRERGRDKNYSIAARFAR